MEAAHGLAWRLLSAKVATAFRKRPLQADLDDPDGLVEGTGKRIRHVKVRTIDDAERPALRRLIEQQIRLRN